MLKSFALKAKFMLKKFKVTTLGVMRKRHEERVGKRKWYLHVGVWGGVAVFGFLFRTYIVLILLQIIAFVFTPILPDIKNEEALFASQSTIIYDSTGGELYTIHGDENRFEVPMEKIPESVQLATIAAEDDNFYHHPGFDVDAIMKAMLSEIGIGRPRGGSTITQQFVKNVYLSPERTYWRKIQELLLALKVENNFSKEEILTMYLNRIPYGNNAYGIQAAAQTFFGKDAENLTLAESVVLAGLPQAPSRYSPYGQNRDLLMGSCSNQEVKEAAAADLEIKVTGNVYLKLLSDGDKFKEGNFKVGDTITMPFENEFTIISKNGFFTASVGDIPLEIDSLNFTQKREDFAPAEAVVVFTCMNPEDPDYTPGRKDYVLNRMLDLGFITEEEYLAAWQESNNLQFTKYREDIAAPHFIFYVRDLLEEKYGKDLVERGGLRVFTTLNPDLQVKAEELISNHFPHTVDDKGVITWKPDYGGANNAALLSIDAKTGQILAMVGSRDYFETLNTDGTGNDGATNLADRSRQPGSSFKPIVYATGFTQGYAPGSVLWDVDTVFGANSGSPYEPKNFDGGTWGPTTIRKALGGSRNIPAVKMAILAGEPAIVAQAKAMGIDTLLNNGSYGPSIGLGAGEVPMTEMLAAYNVFNNDGVYIPLTPILKVTDSQGNILDEFEADKIEKHEALDEQSAFLVKSILTDPNSRPAGWNGYLTLAGRPSGAKTGTANRRFGKEKNDVLPGDIWTIGFTPQIATAVWLGNNNNTAMNIHAEGLTVAAPIWKKFMEYAHTNLPVENFTMPEGIVQRSVSWLTGKLPSDSTPSDKIVVDYFAAQSVPLEVDNAFITITVDAASGKLPTEYTPESAKVQKTFVNIHSERPDDPDWEKPVRAWMQAYSGQTDANFSIAPTEYDDVHTAATAKNPPRITIVSPVSGSTVAKGTLGIFVDVTASSGVEKVEFYRDGELVSTTSSGDAKGIIPISLRAADGDKFTITAKVYDKLYYSDTSSVEVFVGADTQQPTVRITSPTSGQEVSRDSTLLVKAAAYDSGSDVASVVFFLDGNKVGEVTSTPYQFPLVIRSSTSLGNHKVRVTATDSTGFSISSEASFVVVAGDGNLEDYSIISPADGTVVENGTTKLEVRGQINSAAMKPVEVEFIARNKETGARDSFATLTNPTTETFSAVWSGFGAGKYELYFKAKDAVGKTIISSRKNVEVR
ncbi:MAG: penicillin-binding protein [Candidatus Gracilibacteria bacterium]|nr:penicillin-binding protein [Candidatus Gracilibacteria bacterium]MDD5179405.1 penicillin-binding protein [Candidatus Gracilibacteria bacterium]